MGGDFGFRSLGVFFFIGEGMGCGKGVWVIMGKGVPASVYSFL